MTDEQAKELTERLNRLNVYEQALREIEKFGHSHGHGHGYTCANIAEKVLKEYIDATGSEAEIRRTRAVSLDTGQNVRFYAADGSWLDLTRDDYLSRITPA